MSIFMFKGSCNIQNALKRARASHDQTFIHLEMGDAEVCGFHAYLPNSARNVHSFCEVETNYHGHMLLQRQIIKIIV